MIDLSAAAAFLMDNDNFTILLHTSPDGDAVGSGYALCHVLQQLSKHARVICSDPIPSRYAYFTDKVPMQQFDDECVIAVDLADVLLLGTLREQYGERVQLCIDHHASNTGYAERNFINPMAAANCENVYNLIKQLGVPIDSITADALFTGISTDTGCFRYSNCTADTHRIAAHLIELGAAAGEINRIMFETKSRGRIEVERMALESIEYHFGNRCALMTVTNEMRQMIDSIELDGLAALPRQIEGVQIGVTLKEMDSDQYKVSVRTHEPINASAICARLGGGGHARAAGCQLHMSAEEAKQRLLGAVADEMEQSGCKG